MYTELVPAVVIFDQLTLFVDDCHWYVNPEPVVPPDTDYIVTSAGHGLVEVAEAVPPVGGAVQGVFGAKLNLMLALVVLEPDAVAVQPVALSE